MTVYVDFLIDYGWSRGRSCHMVTDDLINFTDLHLIAEKIELKRSWFQMSNSLPHYDLTGSRRILALAAGAVPIDDRTEWGRVIIPIKRRWSQMLIDKRGETASADRIT